MTLESAMGSNNGYRSFVSRNAGYISAETQDAVADTTLLVAGCGMGSALAICAARTGFRKFILVDGDVVEGHNLNRQFYTMRDVGLSKVDSLKRHILEINPEAEVEAIYAHLDAYNIPGIVAKADIVFDTVDFVDLPAVLALHDETLRLGKPLFTAINVGFGALVWYFPPGARVTMPSVIADDIRRVEAAGKDPKSYADIYVSFMSRVSDHLDAEVVKAVEETLDGLREGRPCPAPQLAVGSFSVAALSVTMMHDVLANRPVVSSPDLVIQSYHAMATKIVSV
jgi:molybdopterin/thiamine biosynthesis adenylyltransferase